MATVCDRMISLYLLENNGDWQQTQAAFNAMSFKGCEDRVREVESTNLLDKGPRNNPSRPRVAMSTILNNNGPEVSIGIPKNVGLRGYE